MAIGALTRHYFNLRHRGLNVWPILGLAAAGTHRCGLHHPMIASLLVAGVVVVDPGTTLR